MSSPMSHTLWEFKSGKYAGKTIEEVFLRDAPHLYRLKAAQKTGDIVDAVNELRKRLSRKKTVVGCRENRCRRPAQYVTFPVDKHGRYWSSAYWWCDRHEPWEKRG